MTDLQTLFDDLVRFQILLWNGVDARLKSECDLPLSSYETMRAIGGRASCRVFDVADELVITIGGASKIVDRLEAQGLCARRPNPDDGRSSLVELTAVARRRLADASAVVDDELTRRVVDVVSDDVDRLASLLALLRTSTRPAAATPKVIS